MGQTSGSGQRPWGGQSGFGQQPMNFGPQANMWGGGMNQGGQGGYGSPMQWSPQPQMQKPMAEQQQTGPAPFTGDPNSYAAMQAYLSQQQQFPGRNAGAGDVFSGQAPSSTGAGHGFINPAYTQMNPLANPNNRYPGFYPGVQR